MKGGDNMVKYVGGALALLIVGLLAMGLALASEGGGAEFTPTEDNESTVAAGGGGE